VPEDLLHLPADQPRQLQAAAMTRRLVDNQAMDQNAARWAVEAWAFALGIDVTSSPSHPAGPPKQVAPVRPGGALQPPTASGGDYVWASTPVSAIAPQQSAAPPPSGASGGLFRGRPGLILGGLGLVALLSMFLWVKPKPAPDGEHADSPGPTVDSSTQPPPSAADSVRTPDGASPPPAPSTAGSRRQPVRTSRPAESSPPVERPAPAPAEPPPVTQTIRPSIAIGVPEVRHNVSLSSSVGPVLGMLIWLPGTLNDAQGRTVQLITRFTLPDGHALMANPNETRLRDGAGLLATFTPPSTVASSSISLADNVLQMSIPYYALWLKYTPVTYRLFLTVTVYLDGQAMAVTQPFPFAFNCGGPQTRMCAP
jgi:hypothetical protein